MSTLASEVRMASTALASAASLLPRPCSGAAARAPASVTRSSSSARLRLILGSSIIECRDLGFRHRFARSAAGAKETTSTRGSASRGCVTERAQESTQASAPTPGSPRNRQISWGGSAPGRLAGEAARKFGGATLQAQGSGRTMRCRGAGSAACPPLSRGLPCGRGGGHHAGRRIRRSAPGPR